MLFVVDPGLRIQGVELLPFLDLENIKVKTYPNIYKHVLSHQKLFVEFMEITIPKIPKELNENQFFSLEEIHELPKPVLIDKFLHEFYF